MSETPLCSVIMPTYRQSRYLETSVLSVKAQTYKPIELIIVPVKDDIETLNVLGKFLSLAPRWIESEKADHIHQINLGLKEAKGKFVTIAASDDFMLPNKIQQEMTVQQIIDAVLVYSRFFQADENLNIGFAPPIDVFSYERLTHRNFVTDCSLVAKSMYDEFGLFDESLGSLAVYDKWLHIAEKYEQRIVLNPIPTFIYRIHSQQKHCQRLADPRQPELYERIVNASLKRKGINRTVKFKLTKVECERV